MRAVYSEAWQIPWLVSSFIFGICNLLPPESSGCRCCFSRFWQCCQPTSQACLISGNKFVTWLIQQARAPVFICYPATVSWIAAKTGPRFRQKLNRPPCPPPTWQHCDVWLMIFDCSRVSFPTAYLNNDHTRVGVSKFNDSIYTRYYLMGGASVLSSTPSAGETWTQKRQHSIRRRSPWDFAQDDAPRILALPSSSSSLAQTLDGLFVYENFLTLDFLREMCVMRKW